MYYLFVKKKEDIEQYREELFRVIFSMKQGRTPVFCELRSARTNLLETIPYNIICGVFLIIGAWALQKLNVPEIISVAAVLIINSLCSCVGNYLFVIIKHKLRLRLCKRLNVEPTEEIIAAMESLEYQSV